MKKVEILLVTCCLEKSRFDILEKVVDNIVSSCPSSWKDDITVFDNASTFVGTHDLLRTFKNVNVADRNVGYWSAIDWWLDALQQRAPRYTYIIESDMIHYDTSMFDQCIEFLNTHDEIGSMRLHEYSIENWRLYNKDRPVENSRRNLWQSHTNKVTGVQVSHEPIEGKFWSTNFLTQLPAINRYETLHSVFKQLRTLERFTEFDFQRLYHERYVTTAVLDGGMFNCDLNPYGAPGITGSWTAAETLNKIGYKSTRFSSITPSAQYNVSKLT